jgi:hypothetical protein
VTLYGGIKMAMLQRILIGSILRIVAIYFSYIVHRTPTPASTLISVSMSLDKPSLSTKLPQQKMWRDKEKPKLLTAKTNPRS